MLQLLGLALIVTTASCCDWSHWSSCNRACGGGNKTRNGACGLWGWDKQTQRATCNEFCYNRGSFYGGHCHCTAWRSGSCCQNCRNIYIAQCKPGKQACGGSPDNIKCTECERYYVPAGYGNGCKRCQHNYVFDRGVPKCTCKDGYRLSSNGYSCYDVDECVVGNSHCNQICSNTVGSFKCSCRQGYTLDSDGQTCSDIDECLTGVAKCGQKCINLPGSYRCSCRLGFTLSTDGSCTDINECSRNNGGCMQTCVNEPGSFHCKCRDGYRLESHRLSCVDIDECSEGTSRCSQKCRNIHGSYTCSCNQGFSLNTDKYTCDDVDDCLGVLCQNGGSCLDNIGSFTCSCKKGFTGRNCENDINECEGFLHGGCEDKCVNTIGSFRCECSGNTTLNNDGISCTGGEKRASVFARHGIARQLLPRGCSTILLTRCTDGNTVDVFLSSTSPWYQLQLNKSIIYTFGIVFVEVNKLALPVSIAGMEIYKSIDSFAIKIGSLALTEKDGLAYGKKRNSNCLNFDITPRDIHDFLMSSSFMKSVFQNIEDILPDWLKFSQFGTDILNVNDLHTELLPGNEIETGTCRGAPVYGNRLYTVLKFGSSFSLSLYGNDVALPKVITNEQFCLIIDICQDYGGSLFLIIPKESRNMLKKLNIIGQFTRKYGIEIQPAGIGISLLNHINVKSTATSLQLWNGDQLFNYQVMPEANLWVDGELVWKPFDSLFFIELKTRSSIFVSVPKITSILRSIFLEEWNVYFNMDLLGSIGIKFKLFGQMHRIQLNVVKSSIHAYASLGGLITRKWCGVNADPPGLFLSVIVDINPFHDIPILKSGLFDFENKVYAYFATDPRPTMNNISTITVIQNIVDLKGAAEIFVNTTIKNVFRYASLLLNTSKEVLSHLKNTAEQFIQTLENFLQELRENNEHVFTNLIEHISDVWANEWSTLKIDAETFCDSIKDNARIAKDNFTNLIDSELIHLKDNIHNIIDTMTSQVMQLYKNPIGFGIRYKGTLNIFFLKFAGLEIEFVYSVDQLGECSRFRKVYELLKGERAARIYGVLSTGLIKLAPFIRMDVGAGLGLAISIDTPNKMIAQFHAEVNVLGIQGQVDTFLTQGGHYFFLTGSIWNTFLAELKISFESSDKKGIDTIDILGRFIATGGDDNSFQDSYLDGLRKIIQKISNAANDRISAVQNSFSNVQKAFSKAQDWLEDKKITIRSANSAFDTAIKSLEYAKDKLEDAKIPFKNAISKLNDAQRKLDSLCKIKTCRNVCIPGIKCRICWHKVWFVKIPFPCCHFTSCMFSIPDPICVAYNLGCRAVRGLAYIALEAAKVFVRLPMLALDAAKLLVSGAQLVVDKSRVVLDIAVAALDLAKIGLEGAKVILEGAKFALEAVKKVVGWGLKALNFIIEYGIQSIIDVKNCGFELKSSSHDATVFHIECEINLFRQGFNKVRLGVNFGNPLQSIWQAAKGTIDTVVDMARPLSGRRKRDVKYQALSGLHYLIREVRNANISTDDFDLFVNDTINTIFNTNGFRKNISAGDYENRVEVFREKCALMKNIMSFFSEATEVLLEMSNETANTLKNASSIDESLGHFNVDDIASNFSIENVGVNTDAAMSHFNMTVDDINMAMLEAKENMTTDPLLSSINNISNDAKTILKNQTEDANNVNIINHWLHAMENASFEYFSWEDCISFLDCCHFATFQLYGLFDAENVTDMANSLNAISRLEDTLLDLIGNTSYTVVEVFSRTTEMQRSINDINHYDVFCSEPPTILSDIGNHNITQGSTLNLFCNATGYPLPHIWWYKDDEYLPDQHDRYLVIRNVSKQDESKYRCVAGNVVANLTSGYAEILVTEDTPDLTRDKPDASINNVGVTKTVNRDDSTSLVVILGTIVGVVIAVIGIATGFAWRLHVRKRSRKASGPGSIVSFNMVRPSDSKPKFDSKVVALEPSTE